MSGEGAPWVENQLSQFASLSRARQPSAGRAESRTISDSAIETIDQSQVAPACTCAISTSTEFNRSTYSAAESIAPSALAW